MRQVQRNRKKQVSETKTEEELDVDLLDIDDSGFLVEVTKKEFTAEAVQDGGERVLDFQEETDTEEFSVAFVEQNYLDMLPSAWEVLEELLQDDTAVKAPKSTSIRVPVIEKELLSSPDPVVLQPENRLQVTDENLPETELSQPYEEFDQGVETVEYRPGIEDDREVFRGDTYVFLDQRLTGQEGGEDALRREQHYSDRDLDRMEVERNAVDVVQAMFEETELEGEVEQMESYGLTEDFEGEAREAYWVDIEGMDMDRTEYFINGELAEESIDAYSLGPDDTITFIESDLFYSDGSEGVYCSGELRLEEAIPEAESIESYDAGEVVNSLEPVIETEYATAAA